MEDTKLTFQGIFKFVICSLAGVILFFVQLPINGNSQLLIDFITSSIQNVVAPYYTQVLLLCSIIYIINMIRKRSWEGSTLDKIMVAMSVLGAIMILMLQFNIGPAFLFEADIIPAAVSNMAKAFVMVFITSFFLPLLLDFGLVDFFGVIFRPVMSLLFRLPGRSAVVAIGAFLGNFTVGHIQCNQLYVTGRLNKREANIVNTCFSTTSIALLLMFAGGTGQMANWGKVFFVTAFVVYAVTAIIVHIPPLSRIPDEYYEGTTPDPEKIVKSNILSEALKAGVNAAEKAGNPFVAIWESGKRAFIMVACIHVSAVFTWVVPALINKYTPIFKLLGMLFLPILNLLGMPNAAELANAIGLSFVNPISATLGLGAMDLAPEAMFFASTFAAPMVIFFGAFLTSMYSTKVPSKFWHVMLIWLERAILVTILCSIFARILF